MTGQRGHRHRVLLVEDHDELRRAVTELLELEGYETVGASDGHEALKALREGPTPCVVLLDLHKPHVYPDIGDLTSRVVYSARPNDVHTSIIDGRVVVREGELLTIDVKKALREARAAAHRISTRVA